MYWILASERKDENEISVDSIPQAISDLDLDFGLGIPVAIPVPKIEILYSRTRDGIKTDNIVIPPRMGLLINQKIRNIFDDAGIRNIQYFPITLKDEVSGEKDEDYQIANITTHIDCIDKESSELEFYEDGEIEFIDKLVLHKNKSFEHIFRLSDFLPVVVISEKLKSKIAEQDPTGFKIYAPEEFDL